MSSFGSTTEFSDREKNTKLCGLMIGIVTKNNDPKGTHRVQVRLPSHEGGGEDDKEQYSTYWARIASFTAGEYVGDDNSAGPRGALFMPEIGDEVILAFEHGDISRPIVLGRVWSDVAPDKSSSGDEKPNHPIYSHATGKGVLAGPVENTTASGGPDTKTKHDTGKNDLSGIFTRAHHKIVFNDNKDEPALYIETGAGHRIHFVDGGKKGILIADPEHNYVWLKSGSANGDIDIVTAGSVNIKAQQDITLTTTKGKIVLESQSDTTVTSHAQFQLKATGAMTLQTGASGSIIASNSLTLQGSAINLN